jgi:cobalt-zinc-cadmium efflux system outer membrane protein
MRVISKIAIVFVVFFLTVSCATFHPRSISPAQTTSTFESRTLDNDQLKEFLEQNLHREITPYPPKSWDFNLLALAAFYYHPDLDVARAKWETARAGVITAGQRPNPSITFVPEYATHSPAGVSPWILSSILDIPIETAGKRGYRIAHAKHLSAAARLDIASVGWRVRGRLRSSLLNLYTAIQTDSVLKGELAVQEEIVRSLEKRLNYGDISRPELTQARISLDKTRLLVDETKKQIAQDRVRLAEAIGLPVDALDGVDISFDFVQEFPNELLPQEVQKQSLLNRPDILSALSQYEATQSTLRLEIAKQYPNIVIGPGYEFDQGENKWSIGISFSLPILNQNQGPIAEAEARRKEAATRFLDLQARVILELDRALAGYSGSLQKLATAESLFTAQKEQEQFTQARLKSGETDRLALLSARLELDSIALFRLKAAYDAQQALGLLEDAVWRPLGPSERSLVVPENIQREEKGGAR